MVDRYYNKTSMTRFDIDQIAITRLDIEMNDTVILN